jgi:hypothetical protein
MNPAVGDDEAVFGDALRGLLRGDFSRLEPLFHGASGPSGERPRIVEWCERGRFANEPEALAEALTCACFLGRTEVAKYLLARGLDPEAGAATGLNAFHWASNRGQLETVRLLIQHKAPLETRNMYGGTVLGGAVWAAVHESKPDHLQIIEELLKAGARLEDAEFPSGDERVDAVLRRYGARSPE